MEDDRLSLVLGRLLNPRSNVIDVGCHIGSFLNLAMTMCPSGKHIAIEASPTKAGWLRRKFPKARIEQVAISDHAGTAMFEENLRRPGFSRLQNGHDSGDPVSRYEVSLSTLDGLEIKTRVDLIKIDIEGSELAALKGSTQLIEANRPSIIFECGADANAGLDRRALFDYLTEMEYDIFTFADFLHDKGPLCFDEFRKCGIYPFRAFNFLAIPA